MQFKPVHVNFNVSDLERSLAFYREALGLHEVRRSAAPDGSFILSYLADADEQFLLELTWVQAHPQAYELGENETHLAFRVDDYAGAHALHEKMGCICFENTAMGLYFIEDPDGYWLEIVPTR